MEAFSTRTRSRSLYGLGVTAIASQCWADMLICPCRRCFGKNLCACGGASGCFWLGTRLRLCGMPQILSAKKTSDVGNVVDLSISTEDQSAYHHTPMVERRESLLNVWLKFPSHGEHEDGDFELKCCVLAVSL